MKTFSEFLEEAKLRQITIGPSRSPLGRQRQQRDSSERAAFKKSGMIRSRPGPNKIGFKAVRGEYTSTAISTYPNQSTYAKDIVPSKIDDKSGRVMPTKERALFLKRLNRQIGNRTNKKIHAVDILPIKDFKKNDSTKLVTRGKEYHSTVKNISTNVKKESDGNPGDIISGKAAEPMPGSKNVAKGRKNRENLYSKVLKASRRDPITNIQTARVTEDFVSLTPEKEERVKNRVGELGRDIQLQSRRMKDLKKKPFGRFRPAVKNEKKAIVKSVRNKANQVRSASNALIDASIGRSAKIQKRIEDLKRNENL